MSPEINREKFKKAQASLEAVKKYQKDRQEQGFNRVYLHYDNVDGDWLEEFANEPQDAQKQDLPKTLKKV